MAQRKTHYTDDHAAIQEWALNHNARPAIEEPHFPSEPLRMPRLMLRSDTVDRTIRPATWEEFFQLVDEQDLVFAYNDRPAAGAGAPLHEFVEASAFREIRSRRGTPSERAQTPTRTSRGTGRSASAPSRARSQQASRPGAG